MCNETIVVNKYKYKGEYVYIGRGSPFGNPFRIGNDGTREEVLEKYRVYFYERIARDSEFKMMVESLRGKTLGCFCRPVNGFNGKLMCHGQIIAGYLDGIEPTEVK